MKFPVIIIRVQAMRNGKLRITKGSRKDSKKPVPKDVRNAIIQSLLRGEFLS